MGKLNAPPWAGMADMEVRTTGGHGVAARCWSPVADVMERADGFVITVELPGMTLDDVAVELRGSDLWVYGTTPADGCGAVVRHHAVERPRGPFARRFALAGLLVCSEVGPGSGQATGQNVSAVLKDGLLTVTLKKVRPVRRSIRID
ncbi:MAG: Hsp20/alpha crystallin family protein [Pseudodesulfovibrio sp.]|uniref:Heat shock protein Hsp20 n=1 Tax=Pseudodesulfovibrio aespoeensis (strain ATCC 700646 / DSM 10631 / Aspo-2) TaxID=643562 RepID=E6VX03_PSEA9|nr:MULTISPECIES: Hsp20/alpha crystallin family protein [Pseudodesulfovibrio]MBU4191826.1 Hsp20/alpha crystallin family protein [Pseudomonadota bacterium]ADU61409.1 heat shock protein Hsp20 [Pseudodesulfovibrio aespoeensis Aspo-2]MBU4245369.1 Hsp20/alpha crystallin family protein [Pseudomonadota bacterium]MBU4379989.1 Hsp20/alpha crystallin family protein [Pseudomonadota bacterium]MBU4474802.1 Hsp20/alpha crystallin family protein [Pseudomonadota bacterium]